VREEPSCEERSRPMMAMVFGAPGKVEVCDVGELAPPHGDLTRTSVLMLGSKAECRQ
jgi:hypothetical protein